MRRRRSAVVAGMLAVAGLSLDHALTELVPQLHETVAAG
jgi:hypothetical protein